MIVTEGGSNLNNKNMQNISFQLQNLNQNNPKCQYLVLLTTFKALLVKNGSFI